ncbi:MAG TPA: hypothetical protein VKB34_05745 [Povalibacter sp.]|nr:hypothetical protein [Povalibacter sp.]
MPDAFPIAHAPAATADVARTAVRGLNVVLVLVVVSGVVTETP